MGGGNGQSRNWAGSRCNAPVVCCHIRPSTSQVNAGDVPQMVVLHGAGQCTAHVSANGVVWPGELTHPWHNPSIPAQLDSLRARQGGCHEGRRVAHLLLELVQSSALLLGCGKCCGICCGICDSRRLAALVYCKKKEVLAKSARGAQGSTEWVFRWDQPFHDPLLATALCLRTILAPCIAHHPPIHCSYLPSLLVISPPI